VTSSQLVSTVKHAWVPGTNTRGRTLALAINQNMTELKQLSEAIQIDVAAARTDVAAVRVDIAVQRTDEFRDKIIQWLSTTDPSSNRHAACKKRQPTTGEWLAKRPEFQEWKGTRSSLLWLHGIRKTFSYFARISEASPNQGIS
jgi:erythromycin esterase-like protein